ncbi:hypothetical protein [Cupriavidus necator]
MSTPTTAGQNSEEGYQGQLPLFDLAGSTPYPVQTTIRTPDALKQVLEKWDKSDQPTAIISGGSIAGYSTALNLHKNGYRVIVAEQRPTYSRQNVVGLNRDAVLGLFGYAPDGALIRYLVDNSYITPCSFDFTPQGSGVRRTLQPDVRFFNWMTSQAPESLPPMAPRIQSMTAPSPAQDLTGVDLPTPRMTTRIDYLDPAWPQNVPVDAVPPGQWSPANLSTIGPGNFAFAQIRNLETGLNRYCAEQGIDIVNAKVAINRNPSGRAFFPTLSMGGEQIVHKPMHPGLIVLAEGAKSENIKKISPQINSVRTDEAYYQANFDGGLHPGAVGFNTSFIEDGDLTVVQHFRGPDRHAVGNIAINAPDGRELPRDQVLNKMRGAQRFLDAIHSPVSTASAPTFLSPLIHIAATRPQQVMNLNVLSTGDSLGTGSPAGGFGASTAAALCPVAIENLVNHPLFPPRSSRDYEVLKQQYDRDVSNVLEVRVYGASKMMRDANFYSADAFGQILQMLAHGRFERPLPHADSRRAPQAEAHARYTSATPSPPSGTGLGVYDPALPSSPGAVAGQTVATEPKKTVKPTSTGNARATDQATHAVSTASLQAYRLPQRPLPPDGLSRDSPSARLR